MANTPSGAYATQTNNDWRASASKEDVILEAWGQGFVVGALMIMLCITIANMRHKVLLHKLILVELVCAMSHGTFCFMGFHGYGWYLSSTAALLYISSWIHNIVAWLKIRPFFEPANGTFSRRTSAVVTKVYLITLCLALVPIAFQIVNNFQFFNNINDRYTAFRPYETLMRDPWWVFVCLVLLHVIAKCYGSSTLQLIRGSPRFGILLAAIMLAIVFTIADIAASIHTHWIGATNGINPWWKFYLVFKCLTDTIMLDDFKTELSRLSRRFGERQGWARAQSTGLLSEHQRDELVRIENRGDEVGPTKTAYNPATIDFPPPVHQKVHDFDGKDADSFHVEHLV